MAINQFMHPNGARSASIPHMAFIECDLIPLQQPSVFILKRHLPVMLRLIAYVGHHGIRIRLADGECAISRLPVEIRELRTLGLDPFGRASFHLLHHLGDGARPCEAKEQMNVVFDAADLQRGAVDVIQRSGEIGSTEQKARQRASVILQVRSGQISASQGAELLGVSRKTYYQWEKRALEGMMQQLEEQPPGRPQKETNSEMEAMQQKIAKLEAQLKTAEQTAEVRAVLIAMRKNQEKRDLKKKKPR